ncbi:MAG: redox-sensing transcriptional repressor Rex [Gemmatimonadota bacterium]|nr:MAG: redox-sensing transcriptional repressor Rex [Gemmatimonadota bacterium]
MAGNDLPRLRRVVLERLMRYYRWLAESTPKKPLKNVTSGQIAEALDIDPTQVRKDFGAIGLQGMGRVGFEVWEVCRSIRHMLGFDHTYYGVLIGAGHLGRALMAYNGFARYGLQIVAAFDNDQHKVGGKAAGVPIKPMRTLKPFIRKHDIRLAILTTPAEVSQKVTDRLVSAGIRAIWNFSPTRLTVPPDVLVRNEHISLGLSQIAYHLKQ